MRKINISTEQGNFAAQLLGERGDWVVCWPAQLNDGESLKSFAHLLAKDFRVLLCDPPATGINLGLPYTHHVSDLVYFAHRMLASMGIEQCHWVGQSAGGVVGAALHHVCPELIASLTLAATPMLSQGRFKLHIAATTSLLSGSRFGRHILASRGAQEMGCADAREQSLLTGYLQKALEHTSPKTISKMRPLDGAVVRRVFENLCSHPPPLLILCGRHDRIVLPRDQHTVAEITHSQYVELNCGHMPLFIEPDHCALAFRSFVQSLAQRESWSDSHPELVAASMH